MHDPAEIPNVEDRLIIPLNATFTIDLRPSVTVSDDSIRKYSPEKRKCYFSDERNLFFFKKYTYTNCKFECLVNATREHCGCAMIYMPRKHPNK